MGWKTGHSHTSKSMGGKSHTDTHHTDSEGKRDRPKSEDLKVSGDKQKPSMRDIHPPKK
jgi:hypothetical protein